MSEKNRDLRFVEVHKDAITIIFVGKNKDERKPAEERKVKK